MNDKTNNYKKQQRSPIYRLASTLALALYLALAAFSAQAQQTSITTNVFVASPGNEGTHGRVSVFDSQSGRQIANGISVEAYNGWIKFSFTSAPGEEFVVAALADTGYVGSSRGTAGDMIIIYADRRASSMRTVTMNDNGQATLAYTDASGAPVRNARVAVVEWTTFGNARRGKTNRQGEYNFNDPRDLEGSDFLAVMWKADGEISLTAVLAGGDSTTGGGGSTGWPAF